MNTAEIKQVLHHREPYLMVSEVTSISEKKIKTRKVHSGEEAHIQGHFPGAPVVPGAMLQELCTQSAGILLTRFHAPVENYNSETTKGHALGVLNKVEFAKYLKIVKPGQPIEAEVTLKEQLDNLYKFSGKVTQSGHTVAKINFNLMNISDSYLY